MDIMNLSNLEVYYQKSLNSLSHGNRKISKLSNPKYKMMVGNSQPRYINTIKRCSVDYILQKFDSFALALSKKDRVAIIFHTDADGITSGVIAAKAVEQLCGKKPSLFLTPAPSEVTISRKIIAELQKKKINKVVIVDLNVDQEPESIKKVEKFAQILILDHHTIQNDVNSPKTTMLKPQFFSKISPSKFAASKLVYDMFQRHTNISDLAWLAVIGIYGDMAEDEWKDFISEVRQKDKITPEKIQKAGGLIVYARSFDEKNGPMKAFKVFYSATSIDDVLDSGLSKYAEKIEKELAHFIEKREQLAQFYPEKKLLIYEISPRYNIKSELVNRLSRNFYPGMTCIVIQEKGKIASISARNQTGSVSMNDLMIRATNGIPGASGGGHVQAAGASITDKGKWVEVFLKRIGDLCQTDR
ncbi:DHHA1 domain protein [uncultured archaeon]|nr:DHHA1 domain protein [uncultured archaeon]